MVLRDQNDRQYRSRVEGADASTLTLARPLDLPADQDLDPGAEWLVTWSLTGGIGVLPAHLVDTRTEGNLRLWSMVVAGAGWVEQRRRFVRVPAHGLVMLHPQGSAVGEDEDEPEVVPGTLVDISEGALRCAVHDAHLDALGYDDKVTAWFKFGDVDFTIPARIGSRRTGVRHAEVTHLVVLFEEPVREADALRRQIFAQQRRTLRGS